LDAAADRIKGATLSGGEDRQLSQTRPSFLEAKAHPEDYIRFYRGPIQTVTAKAITFAQ